MRRLIASALLLVLAALAPAEAGAVPAAGAGAGQAALGIWFSSNGRGFSDTFLVAFREATTAEILLHQETCTPKRKKRKGKVIHVMRCTEVEIEETVPADAFEVHPLLDEARLAADVSAGRIDMTWTGLGDYPIVGAGTVAHPQYGAVADVTALRDATAAGAALGSHLDTGPPPSGDSFEVSDGAFSGGFAILLEGAGAGAMLEGAPEGVRARWRRLRN